MKKIVFGILGLAVCAFMPSASAQEIITNDQLASADLKRGQRAFLRCRACHTLGAGERNKVGPNLWDIFGEKVGTREDFNYSKPLLEADFIWTADRLNEWLIKPKNFLPGNKMAFVGLPQEKQRIDLISYLMNETGFSPEGTGNSGESEGGD